MNLLRYMKNHIRGWLPKEPSFPNSQKTKMVDVNQKTKVSTKTRLALSFAVIFAAVFSTLSIADVTGLGIYAPFFAGVVAAFASGALNVFFWKRGQSSKRGEINKGS